MSAVRSRHHAPNINKANAQKALLHSQKETAVLAKYEDVSHVSDDYMQGYVAGLMMTTESIDNKSGDFHRGYHMAIVDVINLEPESCC